MHVSYDTAMLQQRSIWQILTDAFHRLLIDQGWRPFDFLNSEGHAKHRPITVEAVQGIDDDYKYHPWLRTAMSLPRGKANHLLAILGLYNYYVTYWRGLMRDVVYPIFSQPITELALRTPTYLLCQNGTDRALERGAFSDLLPPAIARRTGKGGANHYLLQVLRHNIGFYRDLILGGQLVRRRWIDRAKVERMLSDEHAVHGGGALSIYRLISAEAWLVCQEKSTG
jgi:hypothetical protein